MAKKKKNPPIGAYGKGIKRPYLCSGIKKAIANQQSSIKDYKKLAKELDKSPFYVEGVRVGAIAFEMEMHVKRLREMEKKVCKKGK